MIKKLNIYTSRSIFKMPNKIWILYLLVLVSLRLEAQNTNDWKKDKVNYPNIFPVSEKIYAISNNNYKSALVDKNGKFLTDFTYESISDTEQNNRIRVYQNQKFGYIDTTGKLVIPCQFDFALDFKFGLACASDDRKNFYFINENGKKVFDLYLSNSAEFNNSLARVSNLTNNNFGVINNKGEWVLPIEYRNIAIENELILAEKEHFEFYLFDKNAKLLGAFENDATNYEIFSFPFRVKKNGKWGFINEKADLIIDYQYDNVRENFNNGVAIVCKKNKCGCINLKNEILIPLDYNQPFPQYFDNKMVVSKANTFGVIDKQNKTLISFNYEKINLLNYENQYFIVKKNKKYGIIDSLEKSIIPIEFDSIFYDFKNKLIHVAQNKKWGIRKLSNQIILASLYDKPIEWYPANKIWLYKNKKKGAVDSAGKITFPFLYDEIFAIETKYNIDCKLLAAKNNNSVCIVDYNGKQLSDYYDAIELLEYGFLVKKQEKTGLLNRQFKEIFKPNDYEIQRVYHRKNEAKYIGEILPYFFYKNKDEKAIIIDTNGVVILAPKYYIQKPYWSEGYRILENAERKIGVIDIQMKIVIPCIYQSVINVNNKNIIAQLNGKYGIIDFKNQILLPFKYDKIHVNDTNYEVTQNGKTTFLDFYFQKK